MSTERVDVLAVMDALANGYLCNEGTKNAFVACSTETKPGDGTKVGDAWGSLREARAAVAELIEALELAKRGIESGSIKSHLVTRKVAGDYVTESLHTVVVAALARIGAP